MSNLPPPVVWAAHFGALVLILGGAWGCASLPAPPAETTLDVDGYTAQGWTLMENGQFDQAVELLHEGLRHHPDGFQVHVTLGQVLARQARTSNQSLTPALETFRRALELGLQSRENTLDTTWSDYQQTDLRNAARMVTLLSRRTGATLPHTVHRYLEVSGHDPVIERNLPAPPPHAHP